MLSRYRSSWLFVGLALAAAAPAQAANPKITLKLENVKVDDAVKQLAAASGVAVSLYDGNRPQGARAEMTASFDWRGITFAKALRQLSAQFMLQPNRNAGGYLLYPSFQPPAVAPAKRVGLVEKGGVRLYARSVGMNDYRRIDFVGGNNSGGGNLTVDLVGELGDGDSETVAGVINVRARDDQGTLLAHPPTQQPYYGGYSGGMYPDEWMGSINVPAAHPKARKLQWLEGDLMVFKSVKPFKVEVSLPFKEPYVRKEAGDLTIVVSRFRTEKDATDDDAVEGLPEQPIGARGDGARVRVRVYSPQNGGKVGSRQGGGSWNVQPVLLGASGKTYSANRTNSTGWGNGQMSVNDSTYHFPNGDDAPVKLVWDLVERSQPAKLVSFRMVDIPLPDATAPPVVRPVAPGVPAGPAQDHPFYEKGGATLVSKVQVGAKAPIQGTVQLGLAAKVGVGWGPIRWIDLDLEVGVAKLEGLKPGSYRLHRKFKPADGDAAPAGGVWSNAEVVIMAVAGKELVPPALTWSLRPTGAPGVKPPVKAPAIKPATTKRVGVK
ncbi:MAG: hypothetical protein ACO1SX_17565 [Actinomycetota bacterium]